MTEKVIFDNLRVPASLTESRLAEVVFEGIDQSGPSYEVRVFVNNPLATPHTARTAEEGYIGSFHVYGYGLWPSEGHVPSEGVPGHVPNAEVQAPITKSVRMTTETKLVPATSSFSITAVAVPYGPVSAIDAGVNLRISNVSFHILEQ
jgi:hypothetical protein